MDMIMLLRSLYMALPLLLSQAFVVNPVLAIELDTQRVTGELFSNSVASSAFAVEVITQDDLKLMPINTLAGALEWINGLDVRQRGSGGTQVDVSIRGAGYEQTLILLDGVRINDPQTGHHNFNIPVVLQDIERIEIVRGPGAAQYGPNGNAGVINLVTRKRVDTESKKKAILDLAFGSYHYNHEALLLAKNTGSWTQFLAALQQQSGSYVKGANLDYITRQGNYRAVYEHNEYTTVLGAGYMQRDFGAQGFYGPASNYADEKIKQSHLYATHEKRFEEGSRLDAALNYRHHEDRFYYLNYAPSRHETDAFQARVRYRFNEYWLLGIEHDYESIDSSQVLNGNAHARQYNSAFLFAEAPWQLVQLSGSLSYLTYEKGDRFVLPVLGVNVPFANGSANSVYANAGRSVRVPSMNDLHMNQAANKGNENVKPEATNSAELGLRLLVSGAQLRAAIFYRDTHDAIDYTKSQADIDDGVTYFTARNIKTIETTGFDIELDVTHAIAAQRLQKLSFAYTYLDQSFSHQYVDVRYSLSHLKHQTIAQVAFDVTPRVLLSSAYKYEERYNQKSYQLWDLALRQHFKRWSWGVSAQNLLDENYIDSGYMEAPGRTLQIELTASI